MAITADNTCGNSGAGEKSHHATATAHLTAACSYA